MSDQSNQPQPDPAALEGAHELTDTGKFAEAKKAYEKLVELFPKDANLWRDLGMTYSVLDEHDKAVAAFNKAVSLQPDFANAWDWLGMKFWETEQFALAAVAFEKAIEADPNNKHSLAALAQVYALLKRPDDAWDTWCKLRDLDPKHAEDIEFMVGEFLEY
jgi:tetratricopeptide (TPR) repeat protein